MKPRLVLFLLFTLGLLPLVGCDNHPVTPTVTKPSLTANDPSERKAAALEAAKSFGGQHP
jgi:hypothetical protein